MIDQDMIKSAQSGVHRMGKNHLVKHLKGQRLTQRQAIGAKCYDCNGMGEFDECDTLSCSLWPYSQFGGLKKGLRGRVTC